MLDNFARLEIIEGRQVLAELLIGDDGPEIRVRRDNGLSAEMKLGPWTDDDNGWGAAEKVLAEADLAEAAVQLDAALAQMAGQVA